MAGADFAVPGSAAGASAQMARLEAALSRYNIRLVLGRSRVTGQPVIRLVDGRTGRPSRQIPGAATRVLAGLAADIVAAAGGR